MKLNVKKVLIGLVMTLGLFAVPFTTTVYANSPAGSDTGGGSASGSSLPSIISAESDKQTTSKDIVGGPSKEKVCVYVSVSIADSMNTPSTAVGRGAYLVNPDYYGFQGDCSADSKINGAKSGPVGAAPWPRSMYWCVGGQNAAGGGKAIANWCMATKSGDVTWASKIASQACGVSVEQINQYLAQRYRYSTEF